VEGVPRIRASVRCAEEDAAYGSLEDVVEMRLQSPALRLTQGFFDDDATETVNDE
jgi:hypothetical protein